MAFLDGHYLLALDGTGYFSSQTIHCASCLHKVHCNGSITYYERHDRAAGIEHQFRFVNDMPLNASRADVRVNFMGAVPLSRERLFDVPSAHQPGRKDALWKQQVNGVTTPFVPTVGRSARTTSKCTAMPHDVCAAPPVNALSVQTRARSLKHCAPHARSSWTSLRCSSNVTACGQSVGSTTVKLIPCFTGWIWPDSKALPASATSSGTCLRCRYKSMNSGALSKKTS